MAEGTIDKLSIEVSSDASKAARGIKELTDALTGLKRGVGKTATKLDEKVKAIYRELDSEWEKLVKSQHRVVQ